MQYLSKANHGTRTRHTGAFLALPLLAALGGCAAGPSTSQVILPDAAPIESTEAYEQAVLALENGHWEMANGLLLTALENDPSLAQDKSFMRKLAESAKEMGIDDFHSEVYGLGVAQ